LSGLEEELCHREESSSGFGGLSSLGSLSHRLVLLDDTFSKGGKSAVDSGRRVFRTRRPVLVLLFLASSAAGFFMLVGKLLRRWMPRLRCSQLDSPLTGTRTSSCGWEALTSVITEDGEQVSAAGADRRVFRFIGGVLQGPGMMIWGDEDCSMVGMIIVGFG
jgi:hypothetical protein